jgi:acyl-CoA synthetase (AMP-forming)/AMP-acid ligase II
LIGKRQAGQTRLAFVEDATGRGLTWAGVADRSRAWRGSAGAFRGPRVGLLLDDPLEMAAAVLGAISAGLVAVPLDPTSGACELACQAEQLGLAAVVTDSAGVEERMAAQPANCDICRANGGRLRMAAPGQLVSEPQPALGAALVLASSGTTGTPKIIPLTERQLLHTARIVVAGHELTARDCGYSPLPLFHINGLVVGVLATLVTGGRLVVDRRFSARSFWEVATRHQVTWLNLVPAIITVLGNVAPPAPGIARRIAFARSASAPLAVAARERFEAHTGIGVLETYGMTEAASQIATNPRDATERRPGSVGRPVGLELRIVARSGRPVPVPAGESGPDAHQRGPVGEVQIRGARVTATYWAPAGCDPAWRPATDADGWLATGDLGHLDTAGYLYLAGRVDDVINRGGEKIYPRQIEEILLADPDVQAAAVVGRKHPTMGEEPVAFVLTAAGCRDADALVARLQRRCAAALSRYRRPAEIMLTAHLPAGPTGKVRRTQLRQLLASQAAS